MWFSEDVEPSGPYHTRVLLEKTPQETIKPTCRLVLSIEPGRLRYVLLSSKGKWLEAKSFDSTGLLSEEMFLRFLFEKESILRETFAEIQVYKIQPAFFLIPAPLHDVKHEASLGRLLLDKELFADEIHRFFLPFLDAYILTSLPPELKHILGHYLRDFQFLHPATIVLSLGHRQSQGGTEAFVLFEEEYMLLALYHEKQLQLVNAFVCRTATDVLYYLQLARKGNSLDVNHLRVHYMGDVGFVETETINWEVYGIHWQETQLPNDSDSAPELEPELKSWRYLLV